MAKNLKKILSWILALSMCLSIFATPAFAAGWGDDDRKPGGGWPSGGFYNPEDSDEYEWYQVYLQGNLIASGQGEPGNIYYLGTDYKAGISSDGPMVTWYIRPNGGNAGNFGGTVDLRNYLTVPEGYTVDEYTIEESSVEGVNSAAGTAYFDNAIIRITIKTLMHEETGEEIHVSEATSVTVNHTYQTKDLYTGETVVDGTASSSTALVAGDSYTALAVPSYNGETYVQQTPDSALSITLVADASQNVINIEYLRTIDTTPVATKVTVHHIYRTLDLNGNVLTEDGTVTTTMDATERETYTALPSAAYQGNSYVLQTEESALSIVIVPDASQNVITLEYLRTIDTTPVATSVTVIHKYYTHDAYDDSTVLDGSTNAVYDVMERDSFTAVAVPSFGGNGYTQITDSAKLTITIQADAAANVVEITYLRSIDTTPIDYEPMVTLVKQVQPGDYKAGDTVTWTILVKNVGKDTAYDVVVTDELTGDRWVIDALAPGAEKTFTANLENVPAGTLKNVAVVSWDDRDEIPNDEEEEPKSGGDEEIVEIRERIDYEPILSVEKVADKAVYETGETITWTVTVKNIGKDVAHNVLVTDELTGDHWVIDTLAPGESRNFYPSLVTNQPGTVKNVVVVDWNDGDEIPDNEENEDPTTSDEEVVAVNDPEPENYTPLIRVTKTADKTTYKAGETITWTIALENISDYPAYDITVTDELTGDSWTVDVLAPGESKTFTAKLENAQPGTVKNVVVVDWNDGDEIPDNEENEDPTTSDEETVVVEEPVNYTPVVRIVKTASKANYTTGDTVTWYVSVENISDYPAYDVTVTDDLTGDVWKIDVLAPGESKTFAATTLTTASGYLTNVAKVTWADGDEIPDGEEPEEVKSGSDEVVVTVTDPVNPASDDDEDEDKDDKDDNKAKDDPTVLRATAPKTGDISGILALISLTSLGGMILVNRKKDEA